MLLKRMQPYWRNILKNKKSCTGNYYICKKFAMILIVLIVFTGCGQNRITEKEEKKETVESEMNAEVKKTAQTFRSDRKSTRLNSSHSRASRMPSSA